MAPTLMHDVFAQSVEDLEQIQQAVDTSRVSGWDIVAAVVVLGAAWPIGHVAGGMSRRLVRRIPNLPDYAEGLMVRFVRAIIGFVALAIAMSLVGVDVGWFTITLAFIVLIVGLMVRPLIENLASGLLLETRPSFSLGDEIETQGVRGEVLEINARITIIRTTDWRRVHIPNNDVLSDNIVVYTALARRRSALDLEVEYGADMSVAVERLTSAAASVDGVLADPAPSVRATGFGDGTVQLTLRWWHDPHLGAGTKTVDGVVFAVKHALDSAGIEMPSPELIVRQPDVRQE